MVRKIVLAVALGVPAVAACGIPKSQYDALQEKEEKEKADAEKEIAELKAKITEIEGRSGALDEQTKKELEELRAQKVAAESRAKLFDDFVQKFKSMIDAGKLDIATRRGQIVLALATDVLFDEGKTEIKAEGKTAIGEVAAALKGVAGRRFQVSGHTDTFPIHSKEFPSNWELSTARAVAVVKLLVERGVKADQLSAAGYAEFDAVQSNKDDKGRAKNRRIEIVLMPNIEELVKMPELKPVEHTPTAPTASSAAPTATTTAKPPVKPPKKK
jgi:chemotaxis protein MotB